MPSTIMHIIVTGQNENRMRPNFLQITIISSRRYDTPELPIVARWTICSDNIIKPVSAKEETCAAGCMADG